MKKTKSIILFSGGLDSTTLLALAISRNEEVWPLTIHYGQRHETEITSAENILKHYTISGNAKEMKLDLSFLDGCSLINKNIDVPEIHSQSIPNTYVPSRNIIFLSMAAAYAEAICADKIYIGVNAVDYSGYPDCRPEFIASFQKMINVGSKHGIEHGLVIETPIIHMTKKEIIELGFSLGVDYSMTHSCYNPIGDLACGNCDSCRLRKKGFEDAGKGDPTRYA